MKHVWILTRVDYVTTQHTGMDESTEIVKVFSKKPPMEVLSEHVMDLPCEMGAAITKVHSLRSNGSIQTIEGVRYELTEYEMETT